MIEALVLVVVVVAVLLARSQRRGGAGSAPEPSARRGSRPPAGRSAVARVEDLDRWVAAGLLTSEQADAILEHEKARPGSEAVVPVTDEAGAGRRPSRFPVVAEAIGYLGGVLALSGLVLVLVH